MIWSGFNAAATALIARTAVIGCGVLLACSLTLAQEAGPLPPNANVVRQITGVLAFRALSTGTVRGEERFHITAHPDGARTISTISRYGPRDIQRHSLYRVDAALRPLDATLHYWIEGAWRASGHITVDGDAVSVSGRSPKGNSEQALSIPGPFAILPHQLTPDTMRVLLYDKAVGGVQPLTVYDPEPLAEGPDGLLGKVTTQRLTYEGEATMTVPAGTFAVDHYRVEDSIDLYVTGPDAVLVKWSFPRIDREHVLMQLERIP